MLTAGALAAVSSVPSASSISACDIADGEDFGFKFEQPTAASMIPTGRPGAGLGWQLGEPGAHAAESKCIDVHSGSFNIAPEYGTSCF